MIQAGAIPIGPRDISRRRACCQRGVRLHVVAALLIAVSLLNARAGGAVTVPLAAELTAEQEDSLLPGVIMGWYRGDQLLDCRVQRLVAFHLDDVTSQPPSPFVPVATTPTEVTWMCETYLQVDLSGELQFRFQGRGQAILTINGKEILATHGDFSTSRTVTIRLAQGYQRVVVRYVAPATGPATLRLQWRGESITWEPVPPTRLLYDTTDPRLRGPLERRHGRVRFAQLRCGQCHLLPSKADDGRRREPRQVMPEFLADRPDLADAGNRFRGPWLYAWILSPDQLRTNAHMPRVLDFHPAEERQRIAADIVAYVQSLRPPEATVDNTTINDAPDDGASGTIESPLDEDRVSRGLLLFENLGCIACHSFASPETEDEFDRLSLYYANAKYLPSAMQRFLLNPTAHYRWRPMPDFRLSPEEAQCLAAYVRSASKGQVDGADLEHGDRLRGEIAFSSAGCSACHSIAGKTLPNRTVAPRLPTVNAGRGCLSPTVNGRGKSPFWNLSTVERAELNRFIESDDGSLQRRNHSEAAERLVTSLRCTHCHARDDLTAYLPEILVDEGSRGTAPDILPSLTWAGEKLQGTWIVRQLRGGLAVRPRPWLNTRMPLFAAQAEVLAQGMTAAHGFSMAPRLGPAPDRIMVDIGRRLTRREEGFFCVECHAVGSQPAVGAFAHHGVNFSLVAHRINYDFYLRWITDPARVDPGTKMPTFSPDGTRTSKKLLDGDAPAQFTAIWHYLRQLAEDSNLPVPSAAKD